MSEASGTAHVRADDPLERICKPWGEELILSRRAHSLLKALRIAPGQRLSLQFHRRKRETILLVRGDAILTLGPSLERLQELPLRAGAVIEISPGSIHRLQAGADGADLLEIASHTLEDDEDIVRLDDDYGRTVQTAPSLEPADG